MKPGTGTGKRSHPKTTSSPKKSMERLQIPNGRALNLQNGGRVSSQSPLLAAPLQKLEDGYAALLENAKLCLSETKLLNYLEVPNCENRISDLEALSKS